MSLSRKSKDPVVCITDLMCRLNIINMQAWNHLDWYFTYKHNGELRCPDNWKCRLEQELRLN